MNQFPQATFYMVSDSEIIEIIHAHYARYDYDPFFTEEWHTNCDYSFYGGPNDWQSSEKIDAWAKGGSETPDFSELLADLMEKGIIPAGNYLIQVA